MLYKFYEQGKDLHVANYMAYGKTADHKLYADATFKETVTKEEIEDAFKTVSYTHLTLPTTPYV